MTEYEESIIGMSPHFRLVLCRIKEVVEQRKQETKEFCDKI